MPRFIGQRDYNFFQNISRELLDDVVQSQVFFYKLIAGETTVNLYGEALDKSYYDGVSVFGMLQYGNETQQYDGFGQDTEQEVVVRLNQDTCIVKDIFPEVGDFFYFSNGFYEITNTNQTQLVGMQAENNFGIECITRLTRISQLNIKPRVQ